MNTSKPEIQSLINLKTLIKIKQPDSSALQVNGINGKSKSNLNQSGLSTKQNLSNKANSKSPNKIFSTQKANNKPQLKQNLSSNAINKESNPTCLNDNVNYTVFTSKEPSGSIVCSNKPINGKLINSSFLTEKDLYEYSYTLIKDSNILLFDKVYNETVKIDTIYKEQLKLQVSELFQGHNSCMLFFGPIDSGKSFSLRGGENNQEKGLLAKTVSEILNLIEISKQANLGGVNYSHFGLSLSCYQVFNDIIHDLLGKDYSKELKLAISNNNQDCFIESLSRRNISNQKDLDISIKEIIQFRKLLTQSLKINDLKRKSSLVFNLIIEKRESFENKNASNKESKITKFSQLDFVELPSSNYGLPPEIEKGEIFKNISKTFNSIVNNIVSFSNGKLPKLESKLSLSLKSTLRPGSSIFFMTCVNPIEFPLGDSYQALKFTNWMRNQVLNLSPNPEYPISFSKDNKKQFMNIDEETTTNNKVNFTVADDEENENKVPNNILKLDRYYTENNVYDNNNDLQDSNEVQEKMNKGNVQTGLLNKKIPNNNQVYTHINYGTDNKNLYNFPQNTKCTVNNRNNFNTNNNSNNNQEYFESLQHENTLKEGTNFNSSNQIPQSINQNKLFNNKELQRESNLYGINNEEGKEKVNILYILLFIEYCVI